MGGRESPRGGRAGSVEPSREEHVPGKISVTATSSVAPHGPHRPVPALIDTSGLRGEVGYGVYTGNECAL